MPKTHIRILWIYPLLTQFIGSLLLPLIITDFYLLGVFSVFIMTTIPSFIFALLCYRQQYHQRNLIQIAFFSGAIMFIYSLLTFSYSLGISEQAADYSLWEQSLAVILFALSFALMKMIYALLVLRLFLAKV